MQTSRLFFRRLFVFSVVFSSLILPSAMAADADGDKESSPVTIAFLPFEIHAAKDLTYLKNGIRDMLASRLAANAKLSVINKANVDQTLGIPSETGHHYDLLEIAQILAAQYLVTGSITQMGTSLSIDAKVIHALEPADTQYFFASAANENEVLSALDQLAAEISLQVFKVQAKHPGKPLSTPSTKPKPETIPFQTAHPDRAFLAGAPAIASPTVAVPTVPKTSPSGTTFTKSQNFKMDILAMDAGDVDGDGEDEIILAKKSKLIIYKQEADKLSEVKTFSSGARFHIHSISVADLNQNGIMEIYVSAAGSERPNSFALEWQNNSFDYIFNDAQWYIKVINLPNEGTTLVGQRAGMDTAIAPGLFRVEQNDGSITAGKKLAVPQGINLFNFAMADLDGDGLHEIIAIDDSDHLRVHTANGKKLWASSDLYGGMKRFIGGEGDLDWTEQDQVTKPKFYVPSRIIVADLNKDNQPDIIVKKVYATGYRILENVKNYPSGLVEALTWNGLALEPFWQTNKLDGSIPGYQLRIKKSDDGSKIGNLYVGLQLQEDTLLKSPEATILTFPIPF